MIDLSPRDLAHGMSEPAILSSEYPGVYRWLVQSSPLARAVRNALARLCEACGAEGSSYGSAFDALTALRAGVFESSRYERDWGFWLRVYGLAVYSNARGWLHRPERLERARAAALSSDWQAAGLERSVDLELRAHAAKVLEAAIEHQKADIGRELYELDEKSLAELLRLGLLWGVPERRGRSPARAEPVEERPRAGRRGKGAGRWPAGAVGSGS